MADAVGGISVVIDEDENTVRVDPVTGTTERDIDDGGVIVNLDAHRPSKDKDEGNPHFENLVDDIDKTKLSLIANELHSAISADDQSRGNWLGIVARAMDFLGLEIKEPRANAADSSAAVEGLSTVVNPLLLEACLKGWANAQAELLPTEGPVKIDDEMEAATPGEDALADAYERDMNHFLTVTATEYYPDTSHMLLWGTYFKGSGFKKIYRCPMKRRPVSLSVDAKDLIVSDTMRDLHSSERITHQIEMRPSVMKRMNLLGAYKFKTVVQPNPEPNMVDMKVAAIQGTQAVPQRPEDKPYVLWECQCELDLDEFAPTKFKGEGVPLPYLVTMDKESREIGAIRRDWKEEDEECERKRMYVKYPYIPGPGFYGTGMLNILGNTSMAMTSAWRLALDASMFANFPAFLIAKIGGRQNTSDIRPSPGTGVPIETSGMPISQVAMPLPYKSVDQGMLALMEQITKQSEGLGGSAEIPTAEGVANVPVGTMLAQIEQATKVMAAAHKGMCQAQGEEIQLITEVFKEYPEDFWKFNKVCDKGFWNEQKLMQAMEDCALVPRSDPNTPSHIHRIARALGLVQLTTNPVLAPRLNVDEILERALRTIGEDPTNLILPPPDPTAGPTGPNPQLITAMANSQKAQTAQFKAQADAQNAQQEMSIKQMEVQGEQDVAKTNLAKEMVIHGHDAQQARADQGIAVQKQGLDMTQAAHDRTMDHAAHGLAVAEHAHNVNMDHAEHELNAQQASHEATMGEAEHQLETDKASHDGTMAEKDHELAKKEANKPAPKAKKEK